MVKRAFVLFVVFATNVALAEPPEKAAGQEPTGLEATLRKLEKDIAAVRGLEFKSPVSAKVISRPADGKRKIQGYYDIKEKALFLYDDISGNYERGVLIHEMVHALQDQHFGLAKLHQTSFGSDGEAALAALIEGDATFTMIEVLKKDQPRVEAMLDAPLEKAKDFRNAFVYAQGARYVKALKERGGWAAVNAAYKNPPKTTAAILHPGGVKTVNLGGGPVHGELALIQMLAARPETAPLAVQAAAGWKADRMTKNDNGTLMTVAFASKDNALRFQSAMAKLRTAQKPELKSTRNEPGANSWHDDKGAVQAVLVEDDHVLLVDAPNDTAYQALLDAECGPPAVRVYSAKDKAFITFGQMTDQLLAADLICVGEMHDSVPNHRIQLQVIKALFAADERLGVGMEMFQRPYQQAIDRYFHGETNEDEFLKASEYEKRWGFDWWLYRPVVEFCRKNGVPLAALNASKELTGRLSKVGYAALSDDEKSQLGEIDFQVKVHRDYWLDRLAKMHGKSATDEEKERSYQVMTTWDEYMGASAAQFQQARGLRRMVVLAGSGHIDRGFGIPARAAKRTGGKVATIHVELAADPNQPPAEPVADYTVFVR